VLHSACGDSNGDTQSAKHGGKKSSTQEVTDAASPVETTPEGVSDAAPPVETTPEGVGDAAPPVETTPESVSDAGRAEGSATNSFRADDGGTNPSPEPTEPSRDYPNGDPGCGLEAAAFCDTFDEIAPAGLPEGRTGDLDPRRYAGERAEVTNYSQEAWAVPYAATRPCRSGLGERVGPEQDLLVCDGSDGIQSRHAMIVTAEQNYGQSGVRIRQPFDFFERVGHIVFDIDGEPGGGLLGWNAVSITQEPSPNPSFAILQNFENGPIPRRGVEIHFGSNCRSTGFISVSQVHVFDDWVDHYIDTEDDGNPPCVVASAGHLNHFEIRISRTHLEVLGTDYSENGIDFGELVQVFDSDIELPFDRGYVHLVTHNHATLKYSDNMIDAWVSRWDNVGFDGPVIGGWREASIPNSLTPVVVTHNLGNDMFFDEDRQNIGYQIGGTDEGPLQTFTFENVNTSDITRASVNLNAHLLIGWEGFDFRDYGLRYRINGGQWQDQALYPGPFSGPFVYGEDGVNTREEGEGLGGRVAVSLAVDPATLVDGDNTFEIITQGVPRNYPPIVANLDLVMFED
jgi:hypothetical protein